ncbi:MAG: stringent starvation protein B [Azoarcus sp.]|uniref:Stringent starvation protein B n=1 Tax=Aromatoleum tolulyticum TaxID=34027 RepID=A0A1N6SSV5_9RHOO|nr:ClpXP protease specificity-enhancing factor [Aromatoleum tolulyticum]MCK9984770.1 stringent starvation protein B [Azoarcus sp.]SIQ44072.1 stringent starvation protein B [Aromatoleum tolulyticum]
MSKVSTKPYLVRAIYDWCLDQGFTPYIAVAVDERTVVPPGYARDGQIVLNLAPDATNHLVMGNDLITFQARFGGVAHALSLPVSNVLAIYARENGHGMAFEPELAGAESQPEEDVSVEGGPDDGEGPDTPSGAGRSAARNHLKVVK